LLSQSGGGILGRMNERTLGQLSTRYATLVRYRGPDAPETLQALSDLNAVQIARAIRKVKVITPAHVAQLHKLLDAIAPRQDEAA
jgi:hypothetical protein